MMEIAPLNSEISEAPENGTAYWTHAADWVRLRVALWKSSTPQKGSVLLFPGRTEYIEKYGRTLSDLQNSGFTTLVIDWRGQGLADRACDDPMKGHVDQFSDYHKDVAAMIEAAEMLHLPRPWYLIGHSLGACIGLRAIQEGLPVSACAFTSPMWGIQLPPVQRLAVWPFSWAALALGKVKAYAPGTDGTSYVMNTAFVDNRLTNDPEMYQYYIRQIKALPEYQLGGPTIGWLYQTLKELGTLSKTQSPDLPCLTFCGEQDVVVDLSAINARLSKWPEAKRVAIPNAKHDIFSEIPQIRKDVVNKMCAFFEEVGG